MGTFDGKAMPTFVHGNNNAPSSDPAPAPKKKKFFLKPVEEGKAKDDEAKVDDTPTDSKPEGSSDELELTPEIKKVYDTENEEDVAEIKEKLGLSEEDELDSEAVYVEVEIPENEETVVLPFKEQDEEERKPVEEEEGVFTTVLCADYKEVELCVEAHIDTNDTPPDVNVENDAEVDVEEPKDEEGEGPKEGGEGDDDPEQMDEKRLYVPTFEQFLKS